MAAARLGCKMTMVGTGWANSHPGCMSRLIKRYYDGICNHLTWGFISDREELQAGVCLLRVGVANVTNLPESALGFVFGVRGVLQACVK